MIQEPASPDDPRLEPYRRIADHAWLAGQGLFICEGRLLLERLLDLPRYEIVSVLVNRAAQRALERPLARVRGDVFVSDDPTLQSIAGFNFHRGCLALVRRPPALGVEALEAGPLLLGLDSVTNPDNVGGLFRTASAFGAGGVLLSPTAGDPFYRKSVRTSMGACLRLPFARAAAWLPALEHLRRKGFRIAALTPHAGAPSLADFTARLPAEPRLVLIVGAEGEGIQAETAARADALVRVPIDPAVDSLNVVVAAGIAMYGIRVAPAER